MRHAALLLLLCACSSITSEESDQLAGHQRNALVYFEGRRFDQAMGQIERGLAIDPEDYKLRALRGSVLLMLSGNALGTDHRMLDESTAQLTAVYETRSPRRHEPYLLLNYALALQKQGRRRLGEELRLRGQASRIHDAALAAQADVERAAANELMNSAKAALGVLIERGELLRVAHNHTMQIAEDMGDEKTLLASSAAYLVQTEKDQTVVNAEIARTREPAYEAEQMQVRASLRKEEMEVRALLAEHHYARQQYEAALAQLTRVLEIDPQRSVDYYNRGRVLLELKRPEDAKADFRKFLATTSLPATSDKKTLALRALDQ